MTLTFASGRHALGICDRCGFSVRLAELREEIVNGRLSGIRTCPTCWDVDHPQLQLGKDPLQDPQALRNPRPENYVASRVTSWGWNPVGGGTALFGDMTPNPLVATGSVGTVTVVVT